MSIKPISHGSISVRKSDLLKNRLLVGVDIGTTLINVIFLSKDRRSDQLDENIGFLTLDHGLFKKEDLEDCLKWVKEHAYLPEGTEFTVRITGAGAIENSSLIGIVLEHKTMYVDVDLALVAGHKIALEQIELERLISPPVALPLVQKFDSKFLENFTKGISSKFEENENPNGVAASGVFPCLINVYGSTSKVYYFDEDGRGELITCPMTGSKTFLGLAKCLLDTNDFAEIIDLASRGNKCNVDTQVKDILSGDPNSPYGKFPPEIPVFAFGKSMDYNTGLETYAKEDVAMSLVGFISRHMSMQSVNACQIKGIKKIFLSGNIFRSNLFLKEIKQSAIMYTFLRQLEILDFGNFSAFGAMLCDTSDRNKYFKT